MTEKNANTEFFSKEIRDLIDDVDNFVKKRELLTSAIKQSYLNTSTNN
jgi:hypothetical protein